MSHQIARLAIYQAENILLNHLEGTIGARTAWEYTKKITVREFEKRYRRTVTGRLSCKNKP